MKARQRRQGFTLVEVLLVVVILAILAATVIPQFTTSGEDARDSSIRHNLQTLRSQIELFKLEHKGLPPIHADDDIAGLYSKTNVDRAVGTGDGFDFGPYLVNGIPNNPETGSNKVKKVTETESPAEDSDYGWLYNDTTGQIWASTDTTL